MTEVLGNHTQTRTRGQKITRIISVQIHSPANTRVFYARMDMDGVIVGRRKAAAGAQVNSS